MNRQDFWKHVERGRANECWPWTRSKTTAGYGNFQNDETGKFEYAHRTAWELKNGRKVPPGLCVMHACDNPACCNWRHLQVGTRADNVKDMDTKGRRRSPTRDTGNTKAKLTRAQVVEMQRRYAAGERITALSQAFGVSRSWAWNLLRGPWKQQ